MDDRHIELLTRQAEAAERAAVAAERLADANESMLEESLEATLVRVQEDTVKAVLLAVNQALGADALTEVRKALKRE